jgi:dolichol-phosphate mannosyltransferase
MIPGPLLSVVVPTFRERENIAPLLGRVRNVLGDRRWEIIFVDDDSSDGTAAVVRDLAADDARVRLVHRVHRRGLSSACIEGMLASAAPFVAVIDADLSSMMNVCCPKMLELLRSKIR